MKKGRTCLYPKGTYQTPAFFFRGGDEFKETEHFQNEYFHAKNELNRAKKELEEAKNEYDKVKAILDDKEGHAIALAESLGGLPPNSSSSSSTDHSTYISLRRKIAELTVDIEDLDHQIQEAKAHASPSNVSAMDRERASLFLQIENLHVKLQNHKRSTNEEQLKLYEILTSREWRDLTNIASEHQISSRIQEALRLHVKNSFEQQNYGDSTAQPPLKRVFEKYDQISELQQLMSKRHQLDTQCQEVQHERTCAQIRRRVSIASLLDSLQTIDNALVELGEEGVPNVDELRRSFLPDGPLSPLKRPMSSINTPRASGNLTPLSQCTTGRSKSDIKRPFKGVNRTRLSPI